MRPDGSSHRMRARIVVGLFAGIACTRCSALVDTGGLAGENTTDSAIAEGDAAVDVADSSAPKDSATDDVASDASKFPADASVFGGNGHAYLVVVDKTKINWGDAKARAEEAGGHLATITSSAENQFVYQLAAGVQGAFYTTNGPWLGGYQPNGSVEPKGGWTWVTNEPWSYENWAASEPSNTNGDEAFLEYTGSPPSSTWNDIDIGADTRAFVIEFE
ncbi:hypothetical protein AKJ09_02765 [Labilithrix luteola]|uniref:C-type lectin domain-containing protein n=1 Tax=Labilithrix luteola TaxID=1391654 RepID=A0A0K1PRT1_9BACT|nr:lectin-like protein [Labilithrix luteola]AKU96101.1 hypothetical protein AKJ09_02765 [Labilithrix luteola]